VLVYSRSQADFAATDNLPEKVITEFKDATHADMHAFMEGVLNGDKWNPKGMYNTAFMVLDEESFRDRKVIMMVRDWNLTSFDNGYSDDKWRKYRLSFGIAHGGWFLLSTHLGF
jgi:hypothetical protein